MNTPYFSYVFYLFPGKFNHSINRKGTNILKALSDTPFTPRHWFLEAVNYFNSVGVSVNV